MFPHPRRVAASVAALIPLLVGGVGQPGSALAAEAASTSAHAEVASTSARAEAAPASAHAEAASAPAHALAARTAGARRGHAVVVGEGLVANARVCVDANRNGRCDPREAAVRTGADGRFPLPAHGALVAEIGTDARWIDPATGASRPVARPLVYRAPAGALGDGDALGPVATELQSALEAEPGALAAAQERLARRIGVPAAQLLANPFAADADAVGAPLLAEHEALAGRIAAAVAAAGPRGDRRQALRNRLALDPIQTVVVIYAENRSFNNLFADFPGADGVSAALRAGRIAPQKDRDGSVLPTLPPAWGGLTAAGQPVTVSEAQTTRVWPNAPFQVDAAAPAWGKPALGNDVVTRDLYHRFFENQMQIDGGRNDAFAAWADSGGLVMGWFDGRRTALWQLAQRYTLSDAFFQGAFGGSFLNHQYLVCACAPEYPAADQSPAHPSIAVLQTDAAGRPRPALALAPNSPPSALSGPPVFVRSGNIAPRDYFGDGTFRAVNTMQPLWQPSGNAPAAGDTDGRQADPANPTTLPLQSATTIGDLLSERQLDWAWYAGGWNAASADRTKVYKAAAGNFQAHHQPFNYYAGFDPVHAAAARTAHLRDLSDLLAQAGAGTLPPVVFYKPIGADNEHPGYASLAAGDAHLADVVSHLQASPQWPHMLIVITYDENGGQWDNAAPPAGDRLGPGTRVPAVFISPFVGKGRVDHTVYDTGSILRFITHRHSLPQLDGLRVRDAALQANGLAPMGDLTDALDFGPLPRH